LEALIDDRVIIEAHGYDGFWPTEYPDRLLLGCWPTHAPVHYANTFVWRTQMVAEFVDDAWIKRELSEPRPSDPT
jgi:hypothetical protein